jgi:uncharacterized membrane protein
MFIEVRRMILLSWFNHIHHFAIRQGLYPVTLSTLLAGMLFAGRVYLSRGLLYHFLVWNLFLAWIPYLVSLWISHSYRRYPGRRWFLFIPGLVWLVFFPNAPYIVTDFLHLRYRPPAPLWYDLGLLASFAWSGLFLAVFSLRTMQALIRDMAGFWISWLFVSGVIGLSGLGIYMGRFLRWNSWDLLFQPQTILSELAVRLGNPFHHPGTFGVTFLFAMFLWVCYLTITAGASSLAQPDLRDSGLRSE